MRIDPASHAVGRAPVPAPLAADWDAFRRTLLTGGLRSALAFLNARTPHRFTAIFRFDGEMLRCVQLVDKWDPAVERCEDIPVSQAFCSVVHDSGEPLEVVDSRTDARFPHLANGPVASYCGALIRDESGDPFGVLCHYDPQPCQSKKSDMPLLVAATPLIYRTLVPRPC